MIDHMGIGARDFEASRRFYDAAFTPLGISAVMEVTPDQTGGYHGLGYGSAGHPFFWVGNDSPRGAGIHVGFAAPNRAAVDAFYAAAMAAGGADHGAPGLRLHYHPNYYAAFVLDPDGLNIEAVCHAPE
jgi:catechol 2,3-dioxygenase-like lactoylglutathione lyase family enzyme